ncbi:conserved hypothetical protein [Gloeothece citriformis PCC 7424]|uniref:Uncharacterized protein n=1 Tax=Gloeothece citriformis (strain PCC 7424) TaxID=65393 RepID=B7K6U1_GLOC7|nr:hypothetical protein [Gloeothece citriformis]ACK72640.1 conserved hypothetical protein [Gloeothece citriformis PCC 7424]
MFKPLSFGKEFRFAPILAFLLTGILISPSQQAQANSNPVSQIITHPVTSLGTLTPVSDVPPEFVQPNLTNDPLNSPYPIPWEWILKTQAEFTEKGVSGIRYYRSPSLVSPDGQYAVYTRVSFSVHPEMYRSRVNSVMFLENLQTGQLQIIRPDTPFGSHFIPENEAELLPGLMSILMPVSWSKDGNYLLSRQFEGVFSSSEAFDSAVIWNRKTGATQLISPSNLEYTTAILMGWNSSHPEQILFRAGFLGDEDWPLVSVTLDGQTVLASNDQSITYGRVTPSIWNGSQALK